MTKTSLSFAMMIACACGGACGGESTGPVDGGTTASVTTSGGGGSATTTVGAGGGGTAGSGGGGAGGQSVDASSDGAAVCTGAVSFHMSAANGMSSNYCVGAECTFTWLTITTASGTPVTMTQGCATSCTGCVPVACPPIACALPQPMMAGGETLEWDGTDWTSGMCGTGMSCRSHECALPGHYVAKMCASHSVPDAGTFNHCSPTPTLTCVEVPFDYPPVGVVEGKIP